LPPCRHHFTYTTLFRSRGCDVYREGQPHPFHSPAFRSAIEADPTGAGDVFAAAFLWHLHQSGGDWQTAADWANCVASFVVEKRRSEEHTSELQSLAYLV